MVMAFLLVVIIGGVELEDKFYFRDINRCQYFVNKIEWAVIRRERASVSAYCVPVLIPKSTEFRD